MPCCTYFDRRSADSYFEAVEDPDIREIVAEVNAIPGERWSVRQSRRKGRRRWFGSEPDFVTYELFSEVHPDMGEWQVINFATDDPGTCTLLDRPACRAAVINYLTGFLAAYQYFKYVTSKPAA